LLRRVAEDAPGTPSEALDELLYHWRELAEHLEEGGGADLRAGWLAFLKREAARDTVRVRTRAISEDGTMRVESDGLIRMGRRTKFAAAACAGVVAPEMFTTLQRVGYRRVWSRF